MISMTTTGKMSIKQKLPVILVKFMFQVVTFTVHYRLGFLLDTFLIRIYLI